MKRSALLMTWWIACRKTELLKNCGMSTGMPEAESPALSGEDIKVLYLMLLCFFLALTCNFSIVINASLFLKTVGAENMPYFYIFLNILAILVGTTFFIKNVNGLKWLLGLTVTAGFFYLIAGFFGSLTNHLNIYLLNSFACLYFIYAFIIFWNIVNDLLTIRQVKKYIGRIYAIKAIGAVLPGLVLKPLLTIISFRSCFLLLFLLFIIMSSVIFYLSSKGLKKKKGVGSRPARLFEPRIFNSEIVQNAGLFIFLVLLIRYFVDYQYVLQISAHFPDKEKLAVFIGLFNSAFKGFQFFWQAFFSGFVFQNFSLAAIFRILPLLTLAFTALCYLMPAFYPVVIFQFCYLVLNNATTKPILNIFLGLVRADLKSRVRFLADGIFACTTIMLAGLSILLVKRLGIATGPFFIFIGIFAFIWLILSFRLNKLYVDALKKLLFSTPGKRSESFFRLPLHLHIDIDHLVQFFQSSHTGKARTIQELARIPSVEAKEAILELYHSELNPQVKSMLSKWVCKAKIGDIILDDIFKILKTDKESRITADLIEALALTRRKGFAKEIFPFISSANNRVKGNAILYTIKFSNNVDFLEETIKALKNMLKSADEKMRVSGHALVGEIGLDCFLPVLCQGLTDPSLAVRKAALISSFKFPAPLLLPELEKMWSNPENGELGGLIERSIVEHRENIFLQVDAVLHRLSYDKKEHAISLIRTLGDSNAVKMATLILQIEPFEFACCLLEQLKKNLKKGRIRQILSRCLAKPGYFDFTPLYQAILVSEHEETELLDIIRAINTAGFSPLLEKSLTQSVQSFLEKDNLTVEVCRRLFFLASFCGLPEKMGQKLFKNLTSGDQRKIDLAYEWLESSDLPQNLKIGLTEIAKRLEKLLSK
ncbi:hypothetical protein ACFL35_15690 [Candidatus Riflebacteria bacterium]